MLAKRIIPCLDVTNGRVVKGTNFVDLVDAGDPVESAVAYNEQQADEIVFLDITASSDGRDTMVDVVRETAAQCFVPLTVGGGIREVADMSRMLLAGADKVGVNTAAIFRPEVIDEGAKAFGNQCIVVAIDAKRQAPGKWGVYTHGGRRPVEGLDAIEWVKEVYNRGAGEILLTSMDADGTKNGYDLELTRVVSEALESRLLRVVVLEILNTWWKSLMRGKLTRCLPLVFSTLVSTLSPKPKTTFVNAEFQCVR